MAAYLGAGLSRHASRSVAASTALEWRRAKRQTNEASERWPLWSQGRVPGPMQPGWSPGLLGTSRVVLVSAGLALSNCP